MGINIDPQKLKLKYELKVYKKMDSWPCSEDVLYEIARYVEFKEKNQISKTKLLDMISHDEEKLPLPCLNTVGNKNNNGSNSI